MESDAEFQVRRQKEYDEAWASIEAQKDIHAELEFGQDDPDSPHVLVMEFRCESLADAEQLDYFLRDMCKIYRSDVGEAEIKTLGIAAEAKYDSEAENASE